MRDRPHAFIRDRGIERREIDRPHRLGAEHERIVAHAFAVDLRLHRKVAQAIEAGFRLLFDAAVEQVHGREIARVLQRAAQGQMCRPSRRRSSSASSSPARGRARRRSAAA